ncbi:MAG: murein hydrolase activator EnvC family protein [Candidatus Kryptoniota bacterium]
MQKRLCLISLAVALLLLFVYSAEAQRKGKVTPKKKELENIRGKIRLYEKKIVESTKKESVSLEALDNLEKQNFKTRQMIKNLSNEIEKNNREISATGQMIESATQRLNHIVNEYSHFVRSFYMQGRMHDIELLLTASSFNEMLVRYEYLKSFTDRARTDVENINLERQQLTSLKESLSQKLTKQKALLSEQNKEEKALALRIAEHKSLISKLRKDKKIYAEQLQRSKKAAEQLENLIHQMIAEENATKERAKKREVGNSRITTGEDYRSSSTPIPAALSTIKGRLPWPVSTGRIIAKFGEQENPVLKTVTLNYGIDISVPENSPVRCVANGEVARIFWLPTFGNLIIVNHQNGLRTVYAHLSDIFVKEGEKVQSGEEIGTCGESLGGSVLHFEVWVDKNKQDPEAWLAKK